MLRWSCQIAGSIQALPQKPGCPPPQSLAPVCADVSEETGQLAGRVRAAAAYMARLDAALKGKLGLEEVEALLAKVGGVCRVGGSELVGDQVIC